ncbi:hypothetical protein BDQ17DRAFT_1514323 [Cyathus striatus]|nr:hypothetical protein BDQ17DRAFT_1514323 [Cyathus striatus]
MVKVLVKDVQERRGSAPNCLDAVDKEVNTFGNNNFVSVIADVLNGYFLVIVNEAKATMGAQPNILDPTFSVDDNDVEPSSLWKARLKARIEQNLDFMIQDAREALHDALSTVTSEVEQKRLRDEFRGHTAQLGMNADREYEVELRKERDERKILKLQVDEALVREQQEILDAIRRNKEGGHGQRYTSASASYSSSRVDVYTPVAGPSYTSGRYERQPPATPSIYVPVSSFPQPYAPSSSFTQVYPLTSSSSQSTVHAAPSSSSASPPSQTYVNASSASSFTQNYTSPSGASPPTQTYVDAPMASSPGQLYTSLRPPPQQEMFRQRAEAIQRRRAEEKLNDQLNWAESIASAFPPPPRAHPHPHHRPQWHLHHH